LVPDLQTPKVWEKIGWGIGEGREQVTGKNAVRRKKLQISEGGYKTEPFVEPSKLDVSVAATQGQSSEWLVPLQKERKIAVSEVI
jgi:hypothetical protein